MKITNNHFKDKLNQVNNFLSTNNKPPADLYESFLLELRVSKLLIPATEKDNSVSFDHIQYDDGLEVLPLFTDEEEYRGDNELQSFDFSFYADIVGQTGLKGVIINPHSHAFFIDNVLLKEFVDDYSISPSDIEPLNPKELKELAETVKNEKLLEFIEKDSNFNKFDEFIKILKNSVLLSVVSSDRDLSEFEHDGVLSTLEVGGFQLNVQTSGREKYAVLFTSLSSIRQTCDMDAGVYNYYQIVSLDKILRYILNFDLEGVLLNPCLEEYYIPRNVLIDIYFNHPEITHNPKYSNGAFFAFMIH